MALYAIGDLHLSLTANKSMEVFGSAWENYHGRIEEGLSVLRPEDALVLAGDTSWGIDLGEAEADFRFLERFPGRKYLVKGNHDYWWTTAAKFRAFCAEKGFHTLELLHNNCAFYGDYALCGTRGWFLEEDAHNVKVLNREVMRLETSLKAAGERPKLCFLHYPPRYRGYICPEILELLKRYGVRGCYYGHLHGDSHKLAMEGSFDGTDFHLVAADYVNFQPVFIAE